MGNVTRMALCGLMLAAPPVAGPSGDPGQGTAGDWRGARWGMTVKEVLAAFPGEAGRIEPAIELADGNAVAAGFEGYRVAGHEFQVRFVFEGGKLVLVSLRTPPSRYAGPEVFEEVRGALAAELGRPLSSEADDNFVDMRQPRWNAGRSQVDLKYIPGVVVVLYHPRVSQAGGP